ncbi:hypothetical protein DIZ27_33805 [Streptomyces sp. NWU339]|nr:hypothetical protein DIZ27_33805 [Streptomyces sp. NWU339]
MPGFGWRATCRRRTHRYGRGGSPLCQWCTAPVQKKWGAGRVPPQHACLTPTGRRDQASPGLGRVNPLSSAEPLPVPGRTARHGTDPRNAPGRARAGRRRRRGRR